MTRNAEHIARQKMKFTLLEMKKGGCVERSYRAAEKSLSLYEKWRLVYYKNGSTFQHFEHKS